VTPTTASSRNPAQRFQWQWRNDNDHDLKNKSLLSTLHLSKSGASTTGTTLKMVSRKNKMPRLPCFIHTLM
jgi:hypothetical protein